MLEDLIKTIEDFSKKRDWIKFHSPKNLSMALAVEAAELAEIFQWLTEEESKNDDPKRIDRVREEIGDIMIYLVELSDKLNIDPLTAAFDKIKKNAKKYPISNVKGKALKHWEYEK